MIRILDKEYNADITPNNQGGLNIDFNYLTNEEINEIVNMDFVDYTIEIMDESSVIGAYRHQNFVSFMKQNNKITVVTNSNQYSENINNNIEALWEAMSLLTDDIIPSLLD